MAAGGKIKMKVRGKKEKGEKEKRKKNASKTGYTALKTPLFKS